MNYGIRVIKIELYLSYRKEVEKRRIFLSHEENLAFFKIYFAIKKIPIQIYHQKKIEVKVAGTLVV